MSLNEKCEKCFEYAKLDCAGESAGKDPSCYLFRKPSLKRVYKYVLNVTDNQILEIPSDTILSVKNQMDELVVYALVDVDNEVNSKYEFRIHGTGHNIQSDIKDFTFLDSILMKNGLLVFHIFYKKIEEQ